MIDFTTLHEQNHRITETSNVLMYLVRERALCDTATTRKVFQEALSMIDVHLRRVDRLVKKHLLAHDDPRDQNLGHKLSAESALLRHNFAVYGVDWTERQRPHMHIKDHQKFIDDTDELFNLMLDRIQRETELVYPLLKRLNDSDREKEWAHRLIH